MTENNPLVIVLILSYNGKELLNDAITSYKNNDYSNFKIVVIDNGSIDNTKDYVENNFSYVTVLRIEKNRGYSGGFNVGLKYAFEVLNADYVLITNNDVKADQKIISSLVEVASDNKDIGFVTGKVLFYDRPEIIQTAGKTEHPIRWNGPHTGFGELDKGQYDYIKEIPFADDVFMLTSKSLYHDVGGYDETFFLQAEQFDWQARAKLKNYKIFYTYKAFLYHKESMTIGRLSPIKEYYNARNPMLVILKHKSPDFFRRYFWNHFIYRIVYRSSKLFFKLKFKRVFSIWKGFISGIIWGIKKRKLSLTHFLKFVK